jgi:hypothetical protein
MRNVALSGERNLLPRLSSGSNSELCQSLFRVKLRPCGHLPGTSSVEGKADIISPKADVPGISSAGFQTETRLRPVTPCGGAGPYVKRMFVTGRSVTPRRRAWPAEPFGDDDDTLRAPGAPARLAAPFRRVSEASDRFRERGTAATGGGSGTARHAEPPA